MNIKSRKKSSKSLSNYLESLFISVDRNEVLGSRSMSLPTLSTMWWEQDYSLGEFEKSNFAVFHPESFDSKLNNYWIQSRKFGFGVNIKSRKKSSKSLMFPYNPVQKTFEEQGRNLGRKSWIPPAVDKIYPWNKNFHALCTSYFPIT